MTPRGADTGMVGESGTAHGDLAENLAALVESEALFRATFENAAVGIAHVAVDGRFLRVNRRLSEITGYKRDGALGPSLPRHHAPRRSGRGS